MTVQLASPVPLRSPIHVLITLLLPLCACGSPTVANTGVSDAASVEVQSTTTAATTTLPDSSEDPDALRLAACVQASDGTFAPTLDSARAFLGDLAGVVADWAPESTSTSTSRPPLELQVRPIIDFRTGSSFVQPPLIELAVPAMPELPDARDAATDEGGGMSTEFQSKMAAIGAERAAATNAALGWSLQLRDLSVSLAPTSSDMSSADIVGCAFAARDWLAAAPAASTALVFVTSGEVQDQDIAANPYASAAGLAGIDHTLMVSICPSNERCEDRKRSWEFLTGLFVGRDDPFVARDTDLAIDRIGKFLEVTR